MQTMSEANRKLVEALLSGKQDSLTQGGAYSVDRLKALTKDSESLTSAIQQATQRLAALKSELDRNQGAQIHCAQDIIYCESTEDEDEPDTEPTV